MIDLEDKYIKFIKNIISKYLDNFEVYLFGSRAKGTARKYSDVDIGVLSDELTSNLIHKIECEFENSSFPFKVDVINLKTVSNDFMKLIKDYLTKL